MYHRYLWTAWLAQKQENINQLEPHRRYIVSHNISKTVHKKVLPFDYYVGPHWFFFGKTQKGFVCLTFLPHLTSNTCPCQPKKKRCRRPLFVDQFSFSTKCVEHSLNREEAKQRWESEIKNFDRKLIGKRHNFKLAKHFSVTADEKSIFLNVNFFSQYNKKENFCKKLFCSQFFFSLFKVVKERLIRIVLIFRAECHLNMILLTSRA